jgi:hypothetical protein
MDSDSKRKEWKKPEVVVLARNKPEEAVLTACKGYSNIGHGTGFEAAADGCITWYNESHTSCYNPCDTLVENS